MEEFRDVKNYEGRYQVSNLGRVKSLDRMITESNGKKRLLNGRVLKAAANSRGYLHVNLRLGDKNLSRTVHQLVAEAFLNHAPCGHKLIVNHKNFIRQDNRLENLELDTQRNNTNKKHVNSSSKYTGVSWTKSINKWRAYIYVNGKNKYLGSFTCDLEASKAYEKALSEII